ncbi:MAG TPA: double zinc ribbon domain-containing protein [Myxococcaceae bacterium]|nr:double zinc ribbon domain-containing protein [Myxococcaceae bacterium]
MSLTRELLALVFPPACAACAALLELEAPFCDLCNLATEPVPLPGCRRCAEPLERPGVCPRCLGAPPPFGAAHAAFVHTGPLARAIHRFKYEGHSELALPLARALADASSAWFGGLGGEPVLVPIPLHHRRLIRRGYDQAALLARALARATGVPLRSTLLRRVRATRRQVGLSEAERTENVHRAFSTRGSLPAGPVVLVDDVLTTGATARAASAALREVGARRVYVLTLARAVGEANSGRFGL